MSLAEPDLRFTPATVDRAGEDIEIDANQNTRAEMAKLASILEIESLKFEARIIRWQKHGLKVVGKIRAEITQACVSTLEPVPEKISVEFERQFLPTEKIKPKADLVIGNELILDPEVEDDPDELPKSGILLWDIVLEELNLSIDPFPRAQTIDKESSPDSDKRHDEPKVHRPFADLSLLMNKK